MILYAHIDNMFSRFILRFLGFLSSKTWLLLRLYHLGDGIFLMEMPIVVMLKGMVGPGKNVKIFKIFIKSL